MTTEELKQARLGFGLTQSQMATLLGYGAVARISEIENGNREPSVSVIRLMRSYIDGYRPEDWPDMSGHVDPGATSCIKCDIELDVKGPTDRVATDRTTQALRSLADQIEADKCEDGHHDIKNNFGEPIGTVYFDFYESHEL